ncbi:putative hydrolase [compost metagenome]
MLHDITVPTLVLNAKNDPFLPGRFLPRSAAPNVTLEYPRHGGHVGFAAGALPGSLDWLPQRLLSHFEHGSVAPSAPQSCHAGAAPTYPENVLHG